MKLTHGKSVLTFYWFCRIKYWNITLTKKNQSTSRTDMPRPQHCCYFFNWNIFERNKKLKPKDVFFVYWNWKTCLSCVTGRVLVLKPIPASYRWRQGTPLEDSPANSRTCIFDVLLSMIDGDTDTSVVFLSSILSLACSPSGSSFVCSAAALSRSGSCDSVPQIRIPASGQLLLWDTKTVKQQVQYSTDYVL